MNAPSVEQLQGGWPADLTSFVGRRRELAEVRRALAASRLVSLVGPGGVGKTRLASRAAWEVRRAFPGGVVLVELAGLEDERLVSQAVVTALGIRDQRARWSPETLAEQVGQRRLLLVFDNCEHVVDAAAATAATLLQRCPDLRILTTTRQPLAVAGEHILNVPALTCPPDGAAVSPDGLSAYEAGALFVDRARAAVSEFVLDERTGPVVGAICRRLDGVPLAIELAAFSLRVLSPEQILQRLDDRFGFLTGGNRAAAPRHRTLRALIDWSFDLCSEQERAVWARASVFADHFDLDGVEAVCSDQVSSDAGIFSVVAGLVDKSILIRGEHEGRVRFRMLESIREYGHEILRDSGQETSVRRRHRDWCLALAEQMRHRWFGPGQGELFSQMRLEHANVRAALDFCVREPGEVAAGVRITDGLRDYWRVSGLISEGRHWCDRLMERETASTLNRLCLLINAAHFALLQTEVSKATALLQEAECVQQELGDENSDLFIQVVRGFAASLGHDYVGGLATAEQVLDVLRESEEFSWLFAGLALVGVCSTLLGDSEKATAYYHELRHLCRERGEKWRQSYALWGLGMEAWRQGDASTAATLVREALENLQDFNDYHTAGLCAEALAWITSSEGQPERAACLLGLAHTIRGEEGGPLLPLFEEYHDQCERQVRGALGERAYAMSFEQGAAVRVDEALGYALGQKRRAEPTPKAESVKPLSRREQEIAGLVAQGMSNKEIANSLVISRRTAEAHVEHILVKLGFTSRGQIAAWLSEQRNQDIS
ncbi:LuxR C-terminal-related transcriptional regulator [Saccharopolyspora sp. TS4A08]|uniref:LuxR C-terminal-related transcriptional regulator n=1 Tax=Saccharopolyspora ipomoeae TaxID=3042027 RepID=A0ABT6PSI6_9PSEU|nr:LuxR C-terminal-related transcriptional regulator [Saccharopolyspora sp. TS4A08]MDI2030608.1 LuxR C-terminal-related transcriptional regulator [Saccharopolyspora sp. TS4A08]